MALEINGRAVETVADLREGDRLPSPGFCGGWIEIFKPTKSVASGRPISLIAWLHDQADDPNAAESRWMDYGEIADDGRGGFTLVRHPLRPDGVTPPHWVLVI